MTVAGMKADMKAATIVVVDLSTELQNADHMITVHEVAAAATSVAAHQDLRPAQT
jgi:hypothetical protein